MRPRRCSAAAALALLASVSTASASIARAQSGVAENGALFLLLPIGARAVGMGQAVTADQGGSEAVWWNPAGLARLDKREAAIHHSQTINGTDDALSIVVPSSLLGVVALSVNILDYGSLDVTSADPNAPAVGSVTPRNLAYAGSYATTIGDHLNAGLTYKVVQFRVDCSGSCPFNTSVATSSALDAGLQYDFGKGFPLTLAAAVRNLGPRLQVNDSPQSDPLPARLQFGVLYRVAGAERFARGLEMSVSGDVLDELRIDNPSTRIGTELTYEKRYHFRAGYVLGSSTAGGPSVGVGLSTGSLVLDLARLFQGLSADSGQPPFFVSLRYLF
jgi:hypothetical protein